MTKSKIERGWRKRLVDEADANIALHTGSGHIPSTHVDPILLKEAAQNLEAERRFSMGRERRALKRMRRDRLYSMEDLIQDLRGAGLKAEVEYIADLPRGSKMPRVKPNKQVRLFTLLRFIANARFVEHVMDSNHRLGFARRILQGENHGPD